jgi:hypothetical protein
MRYGVIPQQKVTCETRIRYCVTPPAAPWGYVLLWGDDMLSYSGVLLGGVGAFVGLRLGSRVR